MSYQVYRVSLMDPGTYQLDIVAFSPTEAESIAKTVFTEALTEQPGFTLEGRKVPNAVAVLAPAQPTRRFMVRFEQITEHEIPVPALTPEEAVIHAKRLVDDNQGVGEFDLIDQRIGTYRAREIAA